MTTLTICKYIFFYNIKLKNLFANVLQLVCVHACIHVKSSKLTKCNKPITCNICEYIVFVKKQFKALTCKTNICIEAIACNICEYIVFVKKFKALTCKTNICIEAITLPCTCKINNCTESTTIGICEYIIFL